MIKSPIRSLSRGPASITRKSFLKQISAASLLTSVGGFSAFGEEPKKLLLPSTRVTQRIEPVAIAMWDFSWVLRHDQGHEIGSEFANWDLVLDELVARGYNAIRLDVFPHIAALQPDGKYIGTVDWGGSNRPVMWGAQHPTKIDIRKALLEFIPKCIDRGILLGLSTWLFGPGSEKINNIDDFVRVWDEALSFLKENNLLKNIYYVDLLNEYPLFNGFNMKRWIEAQTSGNQEALSNNTVKENAHEYNKAEAEAKGRQENIILYKKFVDESIQKLQLRWPELDFIFSMTPNGTANFPEFISTSIAALDIHYWFCHDPLLADEASGYWNNIHTLAATDDPFAKVNEALLSNWKKNKKELVERMEENIKFVASCGEKTKKPVGNTEGWGTVNWLDHPSLSWDIIKESGLICAKLGNKHGYRFNCSSNFTHPQFKGLWNDIAWHKEVTSIIRSH